MHPTRHVCRAGPLRGHASPRLGRRPAQEKEDKEKKPQKPKSAFALYCVKERASVKEVRRSGHGGPTRHLSPPPPSCAAQANADAETKEVTKLLTAQWKGLSEEEKQPFEAEVRHTRSVTGGLHAAAPAASRPRA